MEKSNAVRPKVLITFKDSPQLKEAMKKAGHGNLSEALKRASRLFLKERHGYEIE